MGYELFLGSKGLASEVLVVQLGESSKHFGMLIIPAVAANNKPLPQTKVGYERLRAGGQNGSSTICS